MSYSGMFFFPDHKHIIRMTAREKTHEALLDITREAEARERGLRELTAAIEARDARVVELELVAAERLTAPEKTREALLDLTWDATALERRSKTFEAAAAERLVALQEKDEALRRLSAELNARLTVIQEPEQQANRLAHSIGELQSRTVQLESERAEAVFKADAQSMQLRAFEVEGWRDYFRRRYLRRGSGVG
jgi:chromosome segregation ATPase